MGKLRFLLMTVLITGALGYLTIARAQDNVPSSTTSGKTIYLPTINLNASAQPDQQPTTARDTVVRILYGSQAELEYLLSEYDIFEESCGQSCLVALVSNAEYRRLANEGRLVAVDAQRTSQLAADVSQVRQAVRAAGVDAIESIPGFACYRTVEETYSSLAALAAANPQIATWTDIGDTWEKVTPGGAAGYDMYALKLTNSAIPGPKPKFMLMSAIHAREYTTAELATRFAEELISKYNVDPDVTWLLDYFEVHIIPMVNPDGRKKRKPVCCGARIPIITMAATTPARGGPI
ncbi:MAG: M14 family zinc carboxypeptidase [Caldilineaceae bacterium]